MGVREIVKDKGGDRAITSRGKRGRGSLASILVDSLQDALRASLLPSLCTSVCRSAMVVVVEKGIEDNARTRLARHCHPFLRPPLLRSNRNPGGAPSSLFLASRACENSCTQAAFRPSPISPDPAFVHVRGNASHTRQLSGTNHTSALSIRG